MASPAGALPNRARAPLRVGVLVDSFELPRYLAAVLDDIEREPHVAAIALVVRVAPPVPRRHPWLFSLYRRWDRRSAAADDPLALVDCTTRLRARALEAPAGADGARLPPAVVAGIRNAELDVLLVFGSLPWDLPSDIAAHGVWRYRHGRAGSGPAAFLVEVKDGDPTTHAALEQLSSDGTRVLAEGVYATSKGLSQTRNAHRPYWASASFVMRRLRQLHAAGGFLVPPRDRPEQEGAPAWSASVSSGALARWIAPTVVKKAVRRITQTPPVEYWKIGVRRSPRPLADRETNVAFTWLPAPPGRFYADPFLLPVGDTTWLFFEDWEYAIGRARLSCATIDDAGRLGTVHPILERPYHLSYPCVFVEGGELYMVPETKGAGRIELYRCRHFPDRWEFVRPLLDARAVDTTVYRHDARFWFFTTLFEARSGAPELWLFSAPSLEHAWTAHPASPISLDVRNARGAGAIVTIDQRVLRPSQDGSRDYGYSFSLNEVTSITPERYEERPLVTIEPAIAPGLVATHSYARLGDLEVIDGCERVAPSDRRLGQAVPRR